MRFQRAPGEAFHAGNFSSSAVVGHSLPSPVVRLVGPTNVTRSGFRADVVPRQATAL